MLSGGQSARMDRRLLWFCVLLVPVLAWSAVGPHDRFTWFLEVAPVLIGVPIALAMQRRFPLSSLLLVLLWWHSVILIVGGHYTYARVPLGDWAMEWFGWSRNNYDKIGHFAQGFVPAILAREILIRASPLGRGLVDETVNHGPASERAMAEETGRPSRWLGFLVVSVCLAFSAFYELIEWWVAVASGSAAEDFLGTQGYAWDTQSDMAWALGGAIVALLLLGRWHNRSMDSLAARQE
jgi:putative membrane protein